MRRWQFMIIMLETQIMQLLRFFNNKALVNNKELFVMDKDGNIIDYIGLRRKYLVLKDVDS